MAQRAQAHRRPRHRAGLRHRRAGRRQRRALGRRARATAPLEPGIVRDGEVADVEAPGRRAADPLPRAQAGQARPHRHREPAHRRAHARPAADRGPQGARRRRALPGAGPDPDAARRRPSSTSSRSASSTRPTGPRQRVLLVAARRDMVDAAARRRARRRPAPRGHRPRRLRHDPRAAPPGEPERAASSTSPSAASPTSPSPRARAASSPAWSPAASRRSPLELAERRGLTLEHAAPWLDHVGLRAPVQEIDGDAGIVSDARTVLPDGVRRIADEVRNSLDFHRAQDAAPRRRARRPHRCRPSRSRASPRRSRAELGLPVEALGVRAARPDADRPRAAWQSPPAWRSRRARTHEGRQPHPGRGAPQRLCRRALRRPRLHGPRRASPCSS